MAIEHMDGLDGYSSTTDAFRRGWSTTATYSSTGGAYSGVALYVDSTSAYCDIPTRVATANGANGGRCIGQLKFKLGGATLQKEVGFSRRDRASRANINLDTVLTVYDWGSNTNGRAGLRNVNDGLWHTMDYDINYASASAGFVKVWIDGVVDVNVTGISNIASGTPSFDAIYYQAGSSRQTYIDDIVIATNSGDTPVAADFPLGLCKIPAIVPNGDITSQFTRSAGATNFSCVDEGKSNGNTDYVQAGTTALRDLYDFATLASTPATIYAVQNVKVATNSGGGVSNIKDVLKSGATTVVGSSFAVPSGYYDYFTTIFTVDPDTSAAWSLSGVSAVQAGFESA
jgi:hypothetical protein